MLHVAAENFLHLTPHTFLHYLGTSALNKATLWVLAIFLILAFLHERQLVKKTPALFLDAKRYAARFVYMLFAQVAVLLMFDLYHSLKDNEPAMHMLINIGISLFVLACGFALTRAIYKTQKIFVTKKVGILTIASIITVCAATLLLDHLAEMHALYAFVGTS